MSAGTAEDEKGMDSRTLYSVSRKRIKIDGSSNFWYEMEVGKFSQREYIGS